jgi:hypothetical protein
MIRGPIPKFPPLPPGHYKPRPQLKLRTVMIPTCCAVFLVVFVFLMQALEVGPFDPVYQKQLEAQRAQRHSTDQRSADGTNGVLIGIGGSAQLIVSRTQTALSALTKAAVARDTYGLSQLPLTGQYFIVNSGTKALMIDSTWTTVRVRVLSGPMTGRSGWIPMECFRR